MKCGRCGKEKVPYITDPDEVHNFCTVCDDIPSGAVPSAWAAFSDLITPKE